EDLEDRFVQLRNQLSKKLREMRQKPPSGSGGGVKTVQWPLMGAMSFLIPHINPRKTRGSLSQATQSTQLMQPKESPSVSSVISVPVLSPSAPTVSSPSPLLCTETISSPRSSSSCNFSCLETSSSSLSNNELILNVWESSNDNVVTNVIEDNSSSIVEDINVSSFIKKKVTTPPPDIFHSSKKKKHNIEDMLIQSSAAFQDAAKAVSCLVPTATETKQSKNPYAGAIIAALEDVSTEKLLDCFLTIMNTIKEYRS
ncbi:PREDICTED: uncharacterized protein LOC108770125, partial [Trachymyrmex cornetzi]|uniref:uncharacterized protein LOC108770125 n=1 Tax=Trachymyrmex cornetzi TaxID=471704 RepID=UPI00084F46A7